MGMVHTPGLDGAVMEVGQVLVGTGDWYSAASLARIRIYPFEPTSE